MVAPRDAVFQGVDAPANLLNTTGPILACQALIGPLDWHRGPPLGRTCGQARLDGSNAITDTPGSPDALDRGRRDGTGTPAGAVAAQAERARPAGLLHRQVSALPLRQSGFPRLDREAAGRGARPRSRGS